MGMNIFWRFESDSLATITDANTDPAYPETNMKINTLSTKWKDDGTTNSTELVFDFGSPVPIDSFFAAGYNIKSTDAIGIEYANDASFLVDFGTAAVTYGDKYLFTRFPQVTRRYAKFRILRISPEQREIGRMAFGAGYELTYSLKAPGYRIGLGGTTTRKVSTEGGQTYADLGVTLRVMQGVVPGLPQADHDELQELIEANQTGIPFVAAADLIDFPNQKTIYGTFDNIPLPSDVTIDRWEYPWSMTEQK